MEVSIPKNVHIDKDDLPKGWSYPLKTSEIISGLTLDSIGVQCDLVFSNSLPNSSWRKYKLNDAGEKIYEHLTLANVYFYGARSKQSIVFQTPRFYMTIQVVPARYRQRMTQIIKTEMFPVVLKWMQKILKDPHREHTRTQLILKYDKEWNLTGSDHELKQYLTISVEGETLWHKEFELEEEEDVKKTK